MDTHESLLLSDVAHSDGLPVLAETASTTVRLSIDLHDEDRPILVATDGHSHADPAIVAARFLSGRTGQRVHVFSTVEGATGLQRHAMVKTQVTLTVGDVDWPIHVHAGRLSDVSHQVIVDTRAELLVMGECRQRHIDAPASTCAATEQLTHATIPVYIAAPTLRGVAHRVVVAMDFSETSVRAAHLAARFSAPDAAIYLVHVIPPGAVAELEERRGHLRRIAHVLEAGGERPVEFVILTGSAAPETLAFADGIEADLIACGGSSLPAYPTERRLPPSLGRVARDLMRRTSCSMLIAPEMAVTGV